MNEGNDQRVTIDAWSLEWLIGSAKFELESLERKDPTSRRRTWIEQALGNAERQFKRWKDGPCEIAP